VRRTVWRAAVVVAHVWVRRGIRRVAGENHGMYVAFGGN
jgi:hypothetical protein